MPANPFGKSITKEEAVEFRSRLEGLIENKGWAMLNEHMRRAIDERRVLLEIQNDDFASLNAVNRRIHEANAIEGVLAWVENAIAFCDRAINGR